MKLLLPILILLSACTTALPPEETTPISPEEQEFLDSGRAKAIEDETDLWMFYEDEEAGFEIKYPHDTAFGDAEEGKTLLLTVKSAPIDTLNDTMGYNAETALKNRAALESGEYGDSVDFALEESQNVRNVGGKNAQNFLVLSRFEVCNVTFERKLYFFNNDHQIVITLFADPEAIISASPEFFTTDPENCAEEKIWDFEKVPSFYQTLADGNGPEVVQHWFDVFDEIADTIEFADQEISDELIQGKWISVDDANYLIVFSDNTKTDYYDGEITSEGTYTISGDSLLVESEGEAFKYSILELSENELELLYLPRGNILQFTKTE